MRKLHIDQLKARHIPFENSNVNDALRRDLWKYKLIADSTRKDSKEQNSNREAGIQTQR